MKAQKNVPPSFPFPRSRSSFRVFSIAKTFKTKKSIMNVKKNLFVQKFFIIFSLILPSPLFHPQILPEYSFPFYFPEYISVFARVSINKF